MFAKRLPLSLILAVSSVSVFAQENDLFSDLRNGSVFQSESSGTTPVGSVPRRITSGESLRDMLKTAGFEAKLEGSNQVTAEKFLDPWKLPVLAELSADETTVVVILGLSVIQDVKTQLPADKLLQLMNDSQKHAPAMFVYNSSRQRTELVLVMKNQSLSGQLLRDEINRLAVIARDTSDTWSLPSAVQDDTPEDVAPSGETKPATPAATPPEITPPTTTTTQSQSTVSPVTAVSALAGRWAASKSDKEAFAIEFQAAGTFNLVYINNGSQTKSTGTFALTATELTLSGTDGLKLKGKFTSVTAKQFRFEPAGGSALLFDKSGA